MMQYENNSSMIKILKFGEYHALDHVIGSKYAKYQSSTLHIT